MLFAVQQARYSLSVAVYSRAGERSCNRSSGRRRKEVSRGDCQWAALAARQTWCILCAALFLGFANTLTVRGQQQQGEINGFTSSSIWTSYISRIRRAAAKCAFWDGRVATISASRHPRCLSGTMDDEPKTRSRPGRDLCRGTRPGRPRVGGGSSPRHGWMTSTRPARNNMSRIVQTPPRVGPPQALEARARSSQPRTPGYAPPVVPSRGAAMKADVCGSASLYSPPACRRVSGHHRGAYRQPIRCWAGPGRTTLSGCAPVQGSSNIAWLWTCRFPRVGECLRSGHRQRADPASFPRPARDLPPRGPFTVRVQMDR